MLFSTDDINLTEWTGPSDKQRKSMPASAFLDSKNKRYPVKTKDKSGEWKYSKAGLTAAKKRAILQKEPSIANKADRLLARNFGKKK